MAYSQYIKEIGRGAEGSRDLTSDDAQQLYAAMLDGGVPDLELGAIILGLRVKGESLEAFDRSIDVHISRIRAAIEDDPRHPRRILTLRGAGYVFTKSQDGL